MDKVLTTLEDTKRLYGRYWYLIYNGFMDNKTLYTQLISIKGKHKTNGKHKEYNPLVLISENDKETHCIIDMGNIIDWINNENRFKYNSNSPKIFKIFNWDVCISKFKEEFKDIYPLSEPLIMDTIPKQICQECNESLTSDNFMSKSDKCNTCNKNLRQSPKVEESKIEQMEREMNEMKNQILSLRKDLNSQILFSSKLVNVFKNSTTSIDFDKLVNDLQNEKLTSDENIGAVIMNFGNASKNCLPGNVFVPEIKYTKDEYKNKQVVCVRFTDDIASISSKYEELKFSYYDQISFQCRSFPIPKQLLSYRLDKFSKFVRMNSSNFCHVDILGEFELKDENVLLIEKSSYSSIIANITDIL